MSARYIKDLIQWFGNDKIFVYDDVFTVDKVWLREFRDECRKYNVKAKIRCFIHGRMFDEELLDLLLEIGVNFVCLGAESGDDHILDLINKKCTIQDYMRIDNIIKMTKTKIDFECLWMIGNIGETYDTMKRTVELSRQIGNVKPWFSYAIPFPGTVFWQQAQQHGQIIVKDFTQWGNRRIIFVPQDTNIKEMQFWYNKGRRW